MWSTYNTLGGILLILSHVILTTHCHPHYTDEETAAQKGWVTCSRAHSKVESKQTFPCSSWDNSSLVIFFKRSKMQLVRVPNKMQLRKVFLLSSCQPSAVASLSSRVIVIWGGLIPADSICIETLHPSPMHTWSCYSTAWTPPVDSPLLLGDPSSSDTQVKTFSDVAAVLPPGLFSHCFLPPCLLHTNAPFMRSDLTVNSPTHGGPQPSHSPTLCLFTSCFLGINSPPHSAWLTPLGLSEPTRGHLLCKAFCTQPD